MTSPKPVEEYAIEIYSTPEIEEANYWVNQLQLKGINAYIKPFRVRNVNYYKIRIGPFRSIEETKQVARSLGFKNFWIDRVK
jgi:cell division septation protein DedD